MKIFIGLAGILIGFLIGIFAQDQLISYFGGNNKNLALYEQLLNEGNATFAVVDSNNIEEINFKLIDLYEINYFFEVDEKVYTGSYYVSHEDSIPNKVVLTHYLASNPTINEVNVEAKYAEASEKAKSNGDLIWGCITGAFSLLLVLYGASNLKTGIQQQTRKGVILE